VQVDGELPRLAPVEDVPLVILARLVIDDAEPRARRVPVDAVDAPQQPDLAAVRFERERLVARYWVVSAKAPHHLPEARLEGAGQWAAVGDLAHLVAVPAVEVFVDRALVHLPDQRASGHAPAHTLFSRFACDLIEDAQMLGAAVRRRRVVSSDAGQEALQDLVDE
jgi:hypothetical protein